MPQISAKNTKPSSLSLQRKKSFTNSSRQIKKNSDYAGCSNYHSNNDIDDRFFGVTASAELTPFQKRLL